MAYANIDYDLCCITDEWDDFKGRRRTEAQRAYATITAYTKGYPTEVVGYAADVVGRALEAGQSFASIMSSAAATAKRAASRSGSKLYRGLSSVYGKAKRAYNVATYGYETIRSAIERVVMITELLVKVAKVSIKVIGWVLAILFAASVTTTAAGAASWVKQYSGNLEEAYDIMDVEPGASDEEVREAYREKVKETHPDQGGDAETFKDVQWAKDLLDEHNEEVQ